MRRTGKTFRKLLMALMHASEGRNVFYVTNLPHLATWYFERCCIIADSYLSEDARSFDRVRKTIKLENGKITFLSSETFNRREINDESASFFHDD